MSIDPEPEILEAAAAWHVRLQDGGASEADWMAFIEWLESDPSGRDAYDRVEAAWIDVERLPEHDRSPVPAMLHRRRKVSGRPAYWWAAGLSAAAAALAVWVFVSMPGNETSQAFRTDPVTTQAVALEDGTKLTINRSTAIAVTLASDRREASLVEGEVSFDVAHDASRPFTVTAGPRTVQVTGTEFNVLRHDGRVTVTVRRGAVYVGDASGLVLARLTQGAQIVLADADAAAPTTSVNPDDAFAWREGRLVYDNTPLPRVAADLSRYFGRPVRVAPGASKVTVSGVLQIDTQDAMLARLALFAPISARVSPEEIVLDQR